MTYRKSPLFENFSKGADAARKRGAFGLAALFEDACARLMDKEGSRKEASRRRNRAAYYRAKQKLG